MSFWFTSIVCPRCMADFRLYKSYLSNPAWINDLRRADAVFFAAHSQGCIVTTHLVSRLIAQGHIRTAHNADAVARCEWAFGPIGVVPETRRRSQPTPGGSEGGYQKVAMLAMCGVHLGPLYSISTSSVIQPYLQWFENAAARELFEFQDTTSAVSVAYQKSLSMVLENEVKIVLLASYNDQVVCRARSFLTELASVVFRRADYRYQSTGHHLRLPITRYFSERSSWMARAMLPQTS